MDAFSRVKTEPLDVISPSSFILKSSVANAVNALFFQITKLLLLYKFPASNIKPIPGA